MSIEGGTSRRPIISLKSERLPFSIATSLIWALIKKEIGGVNGLRNYI
jgi:hypothetical protein